jgi:MFS family permease
MQRTSLPQIFVLNAYWVGLSFKWNTLHVLLLPALLLQHVPDAQKNTYLGLLTFLGLLAAMLIQPLSGALSDRWRSRWGRRRPLIALGTLFDLLFLAVMGWLGGLPWLVIGYFGLQISSNFAHGPAQGLLPDKVPPSQIGAASGVKNLMDMVGIAAASLWMGRVIAPDGSNASAAVLLIIAIVAVSAAVTVLGTRERSTAGPAAAEADPRPDAAAPDLPGYAQNAKAPSAFWWVVASRFTFLISIYMIQTFAQYYVRDVLNPPNPVQLTGDLLAVLTLALIAFALFGGWLGDRIGHLRLLWAASLVGTLGCLLLLLARTPQTLLAFGFVLGIGLGLFLTSNWALATRLAPPRAAGKYLGLTNLATAGAGAVARLAGPPIDALNALQPGAHWGYAGMFIFGAAAVLISGLLLIKVKSAQAALKVSPSP